MELDSFVDILFETFSCKSSHENVIFSPYCITTALTMVLCGSKGQTRDQITEAFGIGADLKKVAKLFEKFQMLTSRRNEVEVETFNSLFPARNYPVKSKYIKILESLGCQVKKLSYKTEADRKESAKTINDLVACSTRNKIHNIVQPASLDELTRIILASVVYFKAEWAKKFQQVSTSLGVFYNSDNSESKVAMMSEAERFKYGYDKNLDISCLELPYKGYEYSMWFFLPNKRFGLSSDLTVEKMKTMMENSKAKNYVHVKIPKFKFEYETHLKDSFMKLGMTNMFSSDRAELTSISDEPEFHIKEIFHKSIIEVNEEGTEATAVTCKLISLY